MGNLHVRGPRTILVHYQLRKLKTRFERLVLDLTFQQYVLNHDVAHLLRPAAEALNRTRSTLVVSDRYRDDMAWRLEHELRIYTVVVDEANRLLEIRERALEPLHHNA